MFQQQKENPAVNAPNSVSKTIELLHQQGHTMNAPNQLDLVCNETLQKMEGFKIPIMGEDGHLTTEDFNYLGAFGYVAGDQFLQQRKTLDPKSIEVVKARLLQVLAGEGEKIQVEDEERLHNTWKSLIRLTTAKQSFKKIFETALDNSEKALTDAIGFEATPDYFATIIEILEGLSISASKCIFIRELAEAFKDHKITSALNILQFNDTIYNAEVEWTANIASKVVELYKNKSFTDTLAFSTSLSLISKYSYIFGDAIIAVLEFVDYMTKAGIKIESFFEPKVTPTEEIFKSANELLESYAEQARKEIIEAAKNATDDNEVIEELGYETMNNRIKEFLMSRPEEERNDGFLYGNMPDVTMFKFLQEIAENETLPGELNAEYVIQIIDTLMLEKNAENVKSIVGYIAACMKKELYKEPMSEEIVNIFGAELLHQVNEKLDEKIAIGIGSYEENVKTVCEELPKDEADRIVQDINKLISIVTLVDEKQKTYLVSQLAQNGVTTYNHLQQILSLIENAKIVTTESNLATYAEIFNHLSELNTLKSIRENFNTISDCEYQDSFYKLFKQTLTRNFTESK